GGGGRAARGRARDWAERTRRTGAVRVRPLPLVSQLCDGPLLAVGDEDRVVAEPFAAARLLAVPPAELPPPAQRAPPRRQRDELADVAGAPLLAFDPAQDREQVPDRFVAAEPRRADPRPAAEAVDLEARVLAEHPDARLDRPAVGRLRARVLQIGRAVLRGIAVGTEELDPPV